MRYKKRILIVSVLMAALLAQFWLGSRYPSIDEKAAMAGEVVMEDVLSFEAAFPIDPDDPLWKRIGYSTLNWINTNRQGMQFGILFATLVLTILRLWPGKIRPRRTMRDILRGVLVGAPLGVCVNCAAPIAYGMHKEGRNNETSLAMMFASPTLNILVLAMMFSILPMHLAIAKLVVTFAFLFLVLPVLIRLWSGDTEPLEADSTGRERFGAPALDEPERWGRAIPGVAKDLFGSFLFIVIRTVPLMVLAGFLGSALATALPMDAFSQWNISFLAMAGVAVLGTFAPTPIAFDVVVVQALLAAGLPEHFATVLLITLGMFSIYPFLLVSRMISFRFSTVLFTTVAALGLVAGYGVDYYGKYRDARNRAVFEAHFKNRYPAEQETSQAAPAGQVVQRANHDAGGVGIHASTAGREIDASEILVDSASFLPPSAAGDLPFTHHPGSALGLAPPPRQLLDYMVPFSQGRGIASADFDGDGWPDIAAANNDGIALFRNIEGARFERWPLDVPALDGLSTLLVAFVDLDNDGCLDLFVGAFGDADYALINDCAGFRNPAVVEIPHEGALMTQAAAFADIDTDGDLDILKGNWFFLMPRTAPSERATNYIAENLGNLEFSQTPLDEITGYTLAVLFSDFDLDGHPDMVIGNDFAEPDIYYRGGGEDGFEPIPAGGIVPISTLATMSIDTADFDNDLDLDIFLTGKMNNFSGRRDRDRIEREEGEGRRPFVLRRLRHFQEQYCAEYSDPSDAARCKETFLLSDLMRSDFLAECQSLETLAAQDECMLALGIRNALAKRDWSLCSEIPAQAFPVHRQMCEALADYDAKSEPKELGYRYLDQGAIEQKAQGNVMLVQQDDGSFTDLAEDLGVYDSYWAWSGRFADLDQDGWQDLFVVNGWWLETSLYTNDFFRNIEGRRFERQASEFGLENKLKQCCYTYLDFDRDGDLDIVSRALDGGFDVYVNGNQDNRGVIFELRDELGNSFGIGSKIIIRYGENGAQSQIREIKSGGGYVSYDAPFAHFGLGVHERIEGVTVIWPDGERTELEGALEAGNRYLISRRLPAAVAGLDG